MEPFTRTSTCMRTVGGDVFPLTQWADRDERQSERESGRESRREKKEKGAKQIKTFTGGR
jgi:hypothetical protein